jgi:hypothetical protein
VSAVLNTKLSGLKTKELWKNPEYRKHMSDVHKGKLHSGSFKKGHTLRNTGRTRFKKGEHIGKEHWQWKGDEVGYVSLHSWVRRMYGDANKCENKDCKYPRLNAQGIMVKYPKVFHWANKTGRYLRDRKDWLMLCPMCHRKYDRTILIDIYGKRIKK